MRDGEENIVPSEEITVGDIIRLSPGQRVPCDGYIIEGQITCNQAPLTGESADIFKEPANISYLSQKSFTDDTSDKSKIFCGSLISSGACCMAVTRTGDDTLIGKLAGDIQTESRPSPLKKRLSELAGGISYLGYVLAAMIAFAYLFNVFIIDSAMDKALILEKLLDKDFIISQLLHAVTLAVSVVVVAVPEGLPMMITVVLSSNMKKMLKRGVLVRKMVGIETAGSMNILFTDKTGTLTTGNMTVSGVHTLDGSFTDTKSLKSDRNYYEIIKECIDSACSTGTVSATEKAMISYFLGKEKRNNARRTAFDPKLKYSIGYIGNKCYCVGAPEKLLASAKLAISKNGQKRILSSADKKGLYSILSSLATEGARVLCCTEGESDSCTFIGLISIKDPLRKDIKASVLSARNAGIHVMMITGDNGETATAIAKEAGIIHKKTDLTLTSSQLADMSDKELSVKLNRIAVISRALPSDKLRLVKIAASQGLVTGMTGDGINDAPALKAADVGFAMGSGTDIAKESADIVITDDSFKSITNAVLYGRTIFESIRKFIVFQLTMNLCAMGVSLIGPFIGIENPVTVIQMLWVNIIMDTLGGLAFAGEPALRSYMNRPSRSIDEKILSSKMILQIITGGGYSLALCIFFLKSNLIRSAFSEKTHAYFLTAFFALLIFCGIFNSFNARTPRTNIISHIAGNKGFIFIMAAVAIIQIMIIYFGGSVFRCVPLDAQTLLLTALMAFTVIPADMVRKILYK